MRLKILIIFLQIAVLVGSLALVGCGGDPWTYQADRELKPGPGILSGEDGEFTVIGSSDQNDQAEKQTKKNTQ